MTNFLPSILYNRWLHNAKTFFYEPRLRALTTTLHVYVLRLWGKLLQFLVI